MFSLGKLASTNINLTLNLTNNTHCRQSANNKLHLPIQIRVYINTYTSAHPTTAAKRSLARTIPRFSRVSRARLAREESIARAVALLGYFQSKIHSRGVYSFACRTRGSKSGTTSIWARRTGCEILMCVNRRCLAEWWPIEMLSCCVIHSARARILYTLIR